MDKKDIYKGFSGRDISFFIQRISLKMLSLKKFLE